MNNNTSQQEHKIINYELKLSTKHFADSKADLLEFKVDTLNVWMGEAFDCIQLLNELSIAQEIEKPVDGIIDLLGRVGLALSQEHELAFRKLVLSREENK